MRFWLILAIFTVFMASPALAGVTVYELFTARDCPSCPAADDVFQEVVLKRPDIISLACHVTYFNRPGRYDTLSAEFCDGRQTGYKLARVVPKLYTPAVIVNGMHSVKGNDRNSVLTGLSAGGLQNLMPINLIPSEGYITISMPSAKLSAPADVWLFAYNQARAVTSITKLMRWSGKPTAMAFPIGGMKAAGYAVVAQTANQTDIIAAGKTP